MGHAQSPCSKSIAGLPALFEELSLESIPIRDSMNEWREAILRLATLIGSMIVALLVGVMPARSDTRVALVIGNSTYHNVLVLPNLVNDALDVSESLKRLGFDVRTLTNARFDDIRRALIVFGQQARGADFAVIFFAGHGMEIGGELRFIALDISLKL
jgi:hypothetical protein